MVSIVMTGATGFVGQNLIPYLEKNNGDCNIMPLSVRYGDTFTSQGNIYIHLAGKAHDTKSVTKIEEYLEANFLLTQTVYNRFVNDTEARCFIYISSIKAIAEQPGSAIVDENFFEHIATGYGKSKKMAEDYILSKIPENKSVFILRPCMIHGPGNKGNLNLLYRFVQSGIPYPLTAFQNKRSFLSVENLCYVINQLINRIDIESGIYNVADDTAVSTNKIIELIGEILKRKTRTIPIPRFLIRTLAKLGDVLSLPLNTNMLQKLTENYIVSNQKLIEALGHRLPVESEAGLRKTILSFINAH